MAENLSAIERDLFGGVDVDRWRQDLQLERLEQEHRLPSGLMTAVMRQESAGDPTITSKAGAGGLFQFMPATALQYGIDPYNPQQAAPAAAKELSRLYRYYGGDLDKTLAGWNWGQGNVSRKGMGNMPEETKGFLANVKRFLTPASAEAATLPQRQAENLDAIERELFGAAPIPTTAPPPSQGPPGASPADEQYAAQTMAQMRQRQTRAATPAARLAQFQQLPAITALSPEERQAAVAEFQGMNEAQQRAVLASEPAADLPTAMQEGPRATPEQQLRPRPAVLPSQVEPPLEEGITKPSTMIPLLMPGAGAKAGIRLVPEAWRWVGRVGGEVATQTAAELGGRAIETGQAPNWHEIATTTAWNLAPQVIEEGGRAAFRNVLRSGQGARTILSDVAAQESKGLGRRVFHPQDEQVLSKMFEEVKASGVKLDIDPVTDLLTSLKPEQRQVLLRDVKAISSPLAAALQRTGQPGALRLTGWDIGDLQTLRSELIKRGHAVRAPERQDLINEMRMAVDDAIENGLAVGSTAAGGNPETLKAAQAGWRRLKQSDDLQALVTKHTNYSPNIQYQDLNLAALKKSLDGTNPLGRKVAGSLGEAETKALQQELTTLAKRYPFVKVPNSIMNIGGRGGLPAAGYLAITGNVPGAAVAASSAVVALALQSPKAMSLFRSAIVNGKGRLSSNDVAAIVNAVRQVSDVEDPSGTRQ